MKPKLQLDWKNVLLTVLRMAIGWHLLYEGVSKLFMMNWTSQSYLDNTVGFLSGFYHWLTASPALLEIVDLLNIYGLILIGLGLFVGLFVRLASLSGVVLLTLYYFAYPPFGASLLGARNDHLFIVNTLFIEMVILTFFLFSERRGYGIDLLAGLYRGYGKRPSSAEEREGSRKLGRREALKNLASIPILGLLGAGAYAQIKRYEVDVTSGATIRIDQLALSELKGDIPRGKIRDHEISRLVLGGNLIGGWSHSRDLLYVDTLFKAYNTEKKVYDTLMLAEKAGINTINIGFPSNPMIAKYKKVTGSRIKVISQVAPEMKDVYNFDVINQAIDYGVDILQIQGNWCDWMVRDGKVDVIGKMLGKIKDQGYTAGLASHTVDSLIVCEENGIIPDYYMKTMHHDQYWSAHPKENRVPFEVDGTNYLDHNKFHNNMFCLFPERTVEFVQRASVPVMGFKVLAAGAIQPEDGFWWAFENGADFICVGMFDFQIVKDVNICIDTLGKLNNRNRPWYG